MANAIQTYARIRPHKSASSAFEVTEDEPDVIKVVVPTTEGAGTARSDAHVPSMQYRFKFGHVFGMEASQQELFDVVGKRICDGFLEGFNATIFAYGQTGSGKTHTIEGSYQQYANRGLLPRCLDYVYAQLAETRAADEVELKVTYLEIYNDAAYDLLNAASGANARLPKVSVSDRADETGHGVKVHNLSEHGAPNVEAVQSLLFVGKTNRTVARTSMNLASSRSHSVFTLSMTIKQHDSDMVVRSKLNLVDLAGSERVHKSGAKGQQLKEAKHINLSLHYLESVIVSLQKRRRQRHVPYRNSLLTKLLRDSLGGNCVTSMIATLSVKDSNKYESISTCRFAQRVALVDNHAQRNRILDDKSLIQQLRQRIAELQNELRLARQGHFGSPDKSEARRVDGPFSGFGSTESNAIIPDRAECESAARRYVKGKVVDPLECASGPAAIRIMFEAMRAMIHDERASNRALNDILSKSKESDAKLREVQQKYGVAQARLRTIEAHNQSSNEYGSIRGWKEVQPSASVMPSKQRVQTKTSSDAAKQLHTAGGRSATTRGVGDATGGRRAESINGATMVARPAHNGKSAAARTPALDAIAEARDRSEDKLVQLILAEDETVLMVQEMAERLVHQRAVVRKCKVDDIERMLIESNTERQLQEEHGMLSSQLKELRRVRADIERKLKDLDEMEASLKEKSSRGHRNKPPRAAVGRTPSEPNAAPPRRPAPTVGSATQRKAPSSDDMLAQKEEATRQKLLALKKQLYEESAGAVPPATSGQRASPTVRQAHNVGQPRAPSNRPANLLVPGGSSSNAVYNEWLKGAAPRSTAMTSAQPKADNAAAIPEGAQRGPSGKVSPSRRSVSPAQRRESEATSEARFLSAFERQRARVAKIRKSIQAAVVIQRAWRALKQRS